MKENKKRSPGNFLKIMSIIGPGLITVNAGNDAGGIATYAAVGASYGYRCCGRLS
jgi:Mn2+/Fe2+ NRAMP family transporter